MPPATIPTDMADWTDPSTRYSVPYAQAAWALGREADPREKVSKEKYHLQSKQAWAREDIFETEGGFLPKTTLSLLPLAGHSRLRHKYGRQCKYGRPKRDGIKEQNSANTQDGNQAPASSGANTPGPASISDIMPLARPYCSLGS